MNTVDDTMNTNENADWETPRYNRRSNTYTPPHARRADEPPPAPRRAKRSEEFPALVKGAVPKPPAQTLESRFNDLAREMQEERERQELAEAAEEAERVRRARLPAGMVLMPPPPQTGPYTRFRRCDGVIVQPAPMEFREEDWEPFSGSNSDDEEQNTELADHHDRH